MLYNEKSSKTITIHFYLLRGRKSQATSTAIKHFNWIQLPTKYRKMYPLMLQYVDRPQIIHIADNWPLNMETSVKVDASNERITN